MTAPNAAPVAPAASSGKSIQELLATVSASRLNTFHSCRLKFFFQYVLGLKRAKSGAQHVGSSVHFALKLWNLARWRRQTIPDGWLREQFELFWTEDQDNAIPWEEGEEQESKAVSWNLLQLYFKQSPIPPNDPKTTQRTILPVEDVTIEGPDMAITVNRDFPLKALKWGLTVMEMTDSLTAMVFTGPGRKLVAMPIGLEEVVLRLGFLLIVLVVLNWREELRHVHASIDGF